MFDKEVIYLYTKGSLRLERIKQYGQSTVVLFSYFSISQN